MKWIATALLWVACGRPQQTEQQGGAPDRVVIQNKGSDTMVNLAQALAEEYRKVNPNVAVAISGGGSGTGIAALINGTVDVANASRELKPRELEQAKTNTGKDPMRHVVALDALAVVVHRANPLAELSKKQIACIYGADGTCTKWSDMGVDVPGCSGQEIIRVSRQNNSGTYGYFREVILSDKDMKLGSRDMSGSKDVMDLVSKTPCAIGYSGMGYLTPQVKALCVSAEEGQPCSAPTKDAALSGQYPLARQLYMYTLGAPQGAVAEYLRWVLTPAGQAVVDKSGYIPVPK